MEFKPLNPKPNIPQLEEEALSFWEKEKIFEKTLEKTRDGEPFVFFEGPPTANGMPGLHHIEARSFKDAVLRFQTMLGRHVLRRAGWDTHGLPVEIEVEKTLGISGKKQIENLVPGDVRASIEKFNALCRESVWKYKEEWEDFTKRMGFWIDFEKAYITYEKNYIETVWWLLREISEKKIDGKPLLYLDNKVVPFCPRCGTAVSSHEVAQGYERVTENSVYVKFKVKESKLEFTRADGSAEVVTLDKPTYLLSWTTTPWTLPGNVALAVSADTEYIIVNAGKENYILASALAKRVLGDNFTVLETCKGADLSTLSYEPLFKIPELLSAQSFRVYTAGFVTTNDGTGIVHTAVMYGEDDYQLGTEFNLPKFHTVAEDGKFVKSVPGFSGLEVKNRETEKIIIDALKKTKSLLRTEDYTHDYPFCWRCKSPLLYYARSSWFIRMSALRRELIANNEQINWIPEYIKIGRFGSWLREAKDWAISRERYWGTPLPIWRCQDCKEHIVVGSVEELESKSANSQFPTRLPTRQVPNFQTNSKPQNQNSQTENQRPNTDNLDLHRPYIDDIILKCEKCEGKMLRVPEVLDVWFDSGAMPYAQWHYPFENREVFRTQYPADYICEAVDQTRGWFYTLLAVATALGGTQPPYKNVINLGHVLDARGQKMSKSRGNAVQPKKLISQYGIDIVRWYMFTVNQPGDSKRFVEDDLVRLQRKIQHILWNVLNYLLTYAVANKWSPEGEKRDTAGRSSENTLDFWLSARMRELVGDTTENFKNYNIFKVARAIEQFVDELSTWYLRRCRGRTDSNFFQTLYNCLRQLSVILAPLMPFFAEVIFRHLHTGGKEESLSVHLLNWPESRALTEEEKNSISTMQKIRKIVEAVLAFRKQEGLKVRQPLSDLLVETTDEKLIRNFWLLAEELNFVNVEAVKETPKEQTDLTVIKTEGNRPALYINKVITETLAAQGVAREMERQVQALRKDSGLIVGQEVELYYETTSGIVYDAFEYFDQNKVFVSKIIGSKNKVDFETEITTNSEKVWIGLKKSI